MDRLDRRAMLRLIGGGVGVAVVGLAALPQQAAAVPFPPPPSDFGDIQDLVDEAQARRRHCWWHRGRRVCRWRTWRCWWHRGRRVCGWR